MLINSLIVYHLANDFKKLEGMEFVSCNQVDTNSLLFVFTDDLEVNQIEFKIARNETALFMRDNNNSQTLHTLFFKELNTDILQNVFQLNNDRVIVLEFISYKLVIILFGYGKSDVLLVSHNYEILKSSLGRYQLNDNFKSLLNLTDLDNKILITNRLAYTKREVIDKLCFKSEFQNKRLKYLFYNEVIFDCFTNFFDVNYIELGNVITEPVDKSVANILDNNIFNTFYNYYLEYLEKLENCTLWTLFEKEDSYIALPNLLIADNNVIIKKYNLKEVYTSENLNLIISNGFYKFIKYIDIKEKIALYEKPLERILHKNQKLIDNFWNGIDLNNLANKYKYFADLLISLPNNKIKSGNSIKVVNYENEEVEIELDGKINLIDNAQKYYKKSNKTKKEYERKVLDIPVLEKKIELIKVLQLRLSTINNNKELKVFEEDIINYDLINLKDLKIDNNQLNKRLNPSQMLGLKFKKFELKNGFVLFVGKDSDNNDELTTKFAKPNDIWLHSKDLGGSHCIIKNNNKTFPPKEIIEQAAEICAYYSKGRNSKYVPVLYTFKKNVVKPKGAKSGAVRVNKEEVIFVTPNLSV